MSQPVSFSPEAQEQLTALYRYIAHENSAAVARKFVGEIVAFCQKLAEVPLQGRTRDDLRPGLRTVGFRRRALIVFHADGGAVTVLNVFYGGQDYEAHFAPSVSPPDDGKR